MTDRHDPGVDEAYAVMEHVRALRQELLTGAPEPVGDEAGSGLTGPQIAALTHLATRGPGTVTELARALHLSHSTTSGIVDRLQTRGFVTRTRDEHDRRVTRIAPTGVVTDYVERLEAGPFGRLTRALAAASDDERRAVLDGLAALRALLDGERRRGGPVGRPGPGGRGQQDARAPDPVRRRPGQGQRGVRPHPTGGAAQPSDRPASIENGRW